MGITTHKKTKTDFISGQIISYRTTQKSFQLHLPGQKYKNTKKALRITRGAFFNV